MAEMESEGKVAVEEPTEEELSESRKAEEQKLRKDRDEAFGPWEKFQQESEFRYSPEFEVRFSATISTTAAGLEEVKELEKSGESRTVESKGSIVIRALEGNKKAGKLTLSMLATLKCADFRQITGYFHTRAKNPEYQRMIRLNLSGVYLGPKLMRIISDELLNDEKYPYLTWLNLTQTGLKDTPPKKKKRHFEAQLRTQMADAYGTAGPSATASGASHSSSSSSSSAVGSSADSSTDAESAGGLLTSCAVLGAGLARNKSLLFLHLNKNPTMGASGLKAIFSGLLYHPTLHSVWFNSNRMTIDMARELGSFLRSNPSLKRIYMESCSITDEVLAPIIEGLISGNTNIGNLSIPKNAVSDVGVKESVCPLLKGDCLCPVTHVNLSSNNLSEESGKLLGSVLTADNTTILKLDLSYNNIRSAGLSGLFSGLVFNQTLTRLSLSHCGLDDECCEAVSLYFAVNSNLYALELNANGSITDEGIAAMSRGLHSNTHMKFLNLSECQPKSLGAKALSEAIIKQVRCSLESKQQSIEAVCESAAQLVAEEAFPKDLGDLVVSHLGFQPMRRLAVKNCYAEQDLPGITFFVDMAVTLKKELDFNFFVEW